MRTLSLCLTLALLPAAAAAEPAPDFRTHIEPVLTKAGCNSGSCHGALAGKGGLKLSLRGYDPDADHFVLTRQALGRRVDRQEPEKSLMLLKPTRQMGAGEAAVNVGYANLVAAATVTVPRPDPVNPRAFAQSPRNNFIDELVLKKLESLRIPPSGPCTDAEFIRRAFLDAAGTLPTPEEVKAFLADNRPDKRARLIDAILERPEFVDYWAWKGSDLLLVSSRKLPTPAMWSFY